MREIHRDPVKHKRCASARIARASCQENRITDGIYISDIVRDEAEWKSTKHVVDIQAIGNISSRRGNEQMNLLHTLSCKSGERGDKGLGRVYVDLRRKRNVSRSRRLRNGWWCSLRIHWIVFSLSILGRLGLAAHIEKR